MPTAISIPIGYPWVLATAAGQIFLNVWQLFLVTQARKKAGIRYPQLYATKEEERSSKDALIFNCTQRAHQNTLENLTAAVFSTTIAGLRFPKLAVALSAMQLVGRVIYTLGYSSAIPAKRLPGFVPSFFGNITLLTLRPASPSSNFFKNPTSSSKFCRGGSWVCRTVHALFTTASRV